jgi:hypothetical protein
MAYIQTTVFQLQSEIPNLEDSCKHFEYGQSTRGGPSASGLEWELMTYHKILEGYKICSKTSELGRFPVLKVDLLKPLM